MQKTTCVSNYLTKKLKLIALMVLAIGAVTMNTAQTQAQEMPNKRQGNYIFTLSEKVVRKPVTYKNRYGITLAADLYMPKSFDSSRKYAAIIVGSPYGGVKEQGAGIYAQNMADAVSLHLPLTRQITGTAAVKPATYPRRICSWKISARPLITWAPVRS